MYIAHRGLHNRTIKENTIPAFIKAINNPLYEGFECDLRETKDKKFVIIHDFFIANKIISHTNYDELKEYDIPLLEDVLKLDTKKIIVIHIKDNDINISKLAYMLNNSHKNIYLMANSDTFLKKIKPYAINFKIGSIKYFYKDVFNYKYYFYCLINNCLTLDIIDNLEKKKIKIFTFGKIIKQYNKNIYYIIDNYQRNVIK